MPPCVLQALATKVSGSTFRIMKTRNRCSDPPFRVQEETGTSQKESTMAAAYGIDAIISKRLSEERGRVRRPRGRHERMGGDPTPMDRFLLPTHFGTRGWKSVREYVIACAENIGRSIRQGFCGKCDKPIAKKRLAAVPNAVCCKDCQSELENLLGVA